VVAAMFCRGKSALDNGTGYSRVVAKAVAKTGDGEPPNMMMNTICKWALLAMMMCVPGILCGQVATFNESTFPAAMVLKPGVTRITGSLTAAGQVDRFYFVHTAGGRLTARVQYVHRNANLLIGVTEWPHLNAAFGKVTYYGPDLVIGGAETALTSPFYLTNGTNSIQLVTNHEAVSGAPDMMQLAVSAPGGKLHPAYTVELDYVPAADGFEGGAGNNTLATATRVNVTVPGTMEGTVGGLTDVEWVRFDVPGEKKLRVWFEDFDLMKRMPVYDAVGSQPLVAELMNAQGIALQSATGSGRFGEEAVAGGQTFYVRIRSQDEYAEGWRMSWVLDDALEPNDQSGEARHVGTLAAGGRLEIGGLTVLDADFYTFRSVLPAGVAIVVAAIPDSMPSVIGGEQLSVISGSTSAEVFRNYAILTTTENGLVTVAVSGGPHGYRLLIKPQSAYDVWQKGVSLSEIALPSYLPAWSDHDGDGVPAGLEWALRRSPFVATPSAISQPYLSGGEWKVNVAMPQGGPVAMIQVKESADLLEWNGVAAARTNFGGSVIPAGRTAGAVITLSRPGVPRQFLRFGVDD
jgi:hypothetical protein